MRFKQTFKIVVTKLVERNFNKFVLKTTESVFLKKTLV